jgi:hypothetical protein
MPGFGKGYPFLGLTKFIDRSDHDPARRRLGCGEEVGIAEFLLAGQKRRETRKNVIRGPKEFCINNHNTSIVGHRAMAFAAKIPFAAGKTSQNNIS